MSVVQYRRDLHRIPEPDRCLPETTAYVRSVLEKLHCRITAPTEGSICAFFDAGKPETVAFRADMDALPVPEQTGLPYASAHPGLMHACGHDGHTAMAMALAEYADAHLDKLPRNVLVIFQPAEETTGGAELLCEAGILDEYRVTRIFGLHLWPKLPAGRVFSRPGALMARSNEVTVTVTGKSVHISRHREGLDALTAGIGFLRRAYAMADSLPPEEPRILRFGKMISGTARNAVSGSTVLEGTLRTYREETHRFCLNGLADAARAAEAETGCTVDVVVNNGYGAVWNHEALYDTVSAALGEYAPSALDAPVLAGEDFSAYQQRVPGIFFFLGIGDTPELHAQNFDFDDAAILPAGVEFLKKLLLLP